MGKQISWIALFLLLVVVPFGSWFYLNKGLNFRKTSLSEILPKDSLLVSHDTTSFFKGKTTVVVLHVNDATNKISTSIDSQFGNTPNFQIVIYDSISNILLKDKLSKFSNKSFVVVDQHLKIRNAYATDLDHVRKMVEHIAMIIPRPKEADIKMKNQK